MTKQEFENALGRGVEALIGGICWGSARAGRHSFGRKKMNELKPCPFCGGEAGITWDKWKDDELYCCVECECGVSTGVYKTVGEAVEHWNRRIE